MTLQPAAEAQRPVKHIDQAVNQNQIHKSLIPMVRVWIRSIGWTVLLSAALAVLFSLAVDGCASLR